MTIRQFGAGLVAMLVGTEFEVAAQATDCDEALRFALTCTPDLVVLDLRMPGGNAIQTAEQIKQELPATQVLLFTASESIGAMVDAYKAGVDGYLNKEADRQKFLAVVRRMIAGKRGVDTQAVAAGRYR